MIESHIYIKKDMDSAGDILNSHSAEIAVFSHRAPGKESDNEDAVGIFLLSEKSDVLAVADGMGGSPFGQDASSLAINAIRSSLINLNNSTSGLREPILDGIENANREITMLGGGAGSTFAVVEISNGILRPYHVGDTQILIVGQRGKIKHFTVPHSPVGYAVEAGLLDEEEAIHHEERHFISNILGSNNMKIEVGPPMSLLRYDTVLIASDGLFDNLRIDEIIRSIRKGPLKSAANNLVSECTDRMETHLSQQPSKPDDMSFILYRRRN